MGRVRGKKKRKDVDDVHDGRLVEIEVLSPTEIVLWVLSNAHWTGGQTLQVGARISRIQNADEARAWLRTLKPHTPGTLAGVIGIGEDDDGVWVSFDEGDFRFVGARLARA
jgi:hypothetical protein